MNTIEITIHSCREGILTISSNQMTVISDQQITAGDIIKSDLHKYKNENRHWHLMVDEILEERPSRGEWNGVPPTWRKIKYHGQ